ncbi:MAG: hypothetical protein RIC30_06615 [Marinoscillum sp.]|uniref:hypothetical protein n=1 Tax=Marinoscillum sp. TaxID=2024838 RepID=UPI0033041F0E
MKNRINDRRLRIFYLGDEPFTERLIRALFARKGYQMEVFSGDLYADPACLLLMDSAVHLKKYQDVKGFKVLMKNEPLFDYSYHLWTKTPIAENAVDNILFFYQWEPRSFIQEDIQSIKSGRLERFVGHDQARLQEVIAEFVDSLSLNLRLLWEAYRRREVSEIGEVAHRMLSGISYYDANLAKAALRGLEQLVGYDQAYLNSTLYTIECRIRVLRSGLIREYF